MLSREALRYLHRLEIRSRRSVNTAMGGQYQSVFRGKGVEFTDLRAYVPGDDIKSIHWSVTARTGVPHVKLFDEERDLQLMILVDVSGSEQFGSQARTKNEVAAEIASFLTLSAGLHNDNVGLALFTDAVEHYVPPKKGRTHMLRVVRDILNVKPRGRATSIDHALRFARRVLRKRGVVFVVSDFIDTGYERSLAVLAKKHDVVAILTQDARELDVPDVGRVMVEDAETGATREIDTSLAANREAMRAAAAARQRTTELALKRAGADVIPLRTDQPYFPALIDFFHRRTARRRVDG